MHSIFSFLLYIIDFEELVPHKKKLKSIQTLFYKLVGMCK